MLTCSLFLNNFQESLSCRRYETWSWTEFLSPGKHAKPAQTQKTCSVQAVHPYLHEQEQPWPRLEQVFPFFSVHISSCTCCLKYKLACICCLAQNRSYFCRQSWDPPKPGQEYLTLLLPLWLVTESMQAIVICFVHVCSVIGTVGIIHYIKKYHLHVSKYEDEFLVEHWNIGLLLSWVSEHQSITQKEQQWREHRVESIHLKEQRSAMLTHLHALRRTTFSKDHTSYSWKLSIDLEYLEYCIHILSCAV